MKTRSVNDQLRDQFDHENREANPVNCDQQAPGKFHNGRAGLQAESDGVEDNNDSDGALKDCGFQGRLHAAQGSLLQRGNPTKIRSLIVGTFSWSVHRLSPRLYVTNCLFGGGAQRVKVPWILPTRFQP